MSDKLKNVWKQFTAERRKSKDSGSDYGQFYRKQEQLINNPPKVKLGLSNSFMKTSNKKK